jgi:DNA-binding transcriptional MerR regulator
MTEGFSGKRTAEIVGITYRQLDYWARTDLIRPSLADATGSGSRRQYSYTDLLQLRIVKQLLDAGLKLENVRTVFAELRRFVGEEIAAANLVIDGSQAFLALDDGQLLDLVKKGQGVLNVMNLGQCEAELKARIVEVHGGVQGVLDVAI